MTESSPWSGQGARFYSEGPTPSTAGRDGAISKELVARELGKTKLPISAGAHLDPTGCLRHFLGVHR